MPTNQLKTKSGNLHLPIFFPDATKCVIKGISTADLEEVAVDGLVVNTYHIMVENTLDVLKQVSGVHNFMNYHKPIISDSGGFQIMTLIRNNPKNGTITDDGAIFKMKDPKTDISKNVHLTPETCIDTQQMIGSDIFMALDDCTNTNESRIEQEKSVERTISWAKRCKERFLEYFKWDAHNRPLLFCIVQGGNHKDLRKYCADELTKIGFDGFAYGGWPVDENNIFLDEIVQYTASVMPKDGPKYAMGVGKPSDIIKCTNWGYNMFDCVLPTRDARHQRLYVFEDASLSWGFLDIGKSKYKYDTSAISKFCSCYTCKKYSKSYVHHLFKVRDTAAYRLATIHNLRFYASLMEKLRTIF